MTSDARIADEMREAIRGRDCDELERICLHLGSYAEVRRIALVAHIPVDVLEEALAEI